jgi:hypothetical protein
MAAPSVMTSLKRRCGGVRGDAAQAAGEQLREGKSADDSDEQTKADQAHAGTSGCNR